MLKGIVKQGLISVKNIVRVTAFVLVVSLISIPASFGMNTAYLHMCSAVHCSRSGILTTTFRRR